MFRRPTFYFLLCMV